MTSCKGNGECLTQCECECYNEETEEYDEICVCGHRQHNGYCPSNCCMLVECRNYKYCNVKQPKWVSNCHNGICSWCAVQMGKHIYTNQLEDCCVCLENNIIVILKCNHKVCNDCWYKITNKGFDDEEDCKKYKPLCPLCRNLNSWGK